MLVLSRKRNEVIVVGEGDNQVEIYVVEIRPDKVRLGFQTKASREELPIHRKEVYEAIQGEND
jgi:carbon storage regulator CsrA